MSRKVKILLIRFSSLGDVTQCLSVPSALKQIFPEAEVHWIVREDLAALLENHPAISKVWKFPRSAGFRGLLQLADELKAQGFTHIYDAHNNLRSRIISSRVKTSGVQFLRKSQKRWWRFLLFQWRINKYPQPLSGQRDLVEPLKAWGGSGISPDSPQIFPGADKYANAKSILGSFENAIALAPSAAFPLKRWPVEYWQELVRLLPNEKFVILGGPGEEFLNAISDVAPERVLNLAGRTDLGTSAAVVDLSKVLVSNDTGPLHLAEQRGKNCIALMGPAPFGFPSRPSTKILQRNLSCRPCSKHGQGPCMNADFQLCLRDIKPQEIISALQEKGLV
ncbi:MAG: glycosyltransferase family 9 protein [Bdellovibrionota bacterium]